MIIWGSKAKKKVVTTGQFFCPNCKADAPYTHIRVAKYFTLYFIPLFETNNLGEYVRCDRCNSEYKTEILDFSEEDIKKFLESQE